MYCYAEGHYAECPYAECRCAECSGAVCLIFVITSSAQLLFKLKLYLSFFAKRPILIRMSADIIIGSLIETCLEGATTFSMRKFSIMTLSIKRLSVTLRINDFYHDA